MENDRRGDFFDRYEYAHNYWNPYVKAAQIYVNAAAGSTWSDAELKELLKDRREPIEFNIMRRPIQFYSGYLRDNLNSTIYSPVEGSDDKTADQLTKTGYQIWDKGSGYSTLLDSADEMFKAGISLCGLQMDYTNDFINGDATFFKRTYNSFYLDPTFEHLDLQDCSFAITRDLIDRKCIKSLLQFIDPKIIDDIPNGFRDDKFLSFHPNFTALSRNRNLLAYDQFYLRTSRSRKYLVDVQSSYYRDITDLDREEIDKLKIGIYRIRKLHDEADMMGIDKNTLPHMVDIQTVERPYVELNVMLNGIPVYQGDDKTGITDTYPFVPLVCYFEPSIWNPLLRVQGLSAISYSNQRQFNKRHMKIQDMFDSTISTGYKYLIGSVPDVEDLQQAGQNKIIGVDPEHAPQGLASVEQLRGGDVNQSLIEYQGILDNLQLELTNVNESVLGIDEKGNTQISGRLAQVRIAQGLRSNRKIFDNIEVSQRVLGKLVLKVIQAKYPPDKIKRMINEEPTAQFYDKEFEQFDTVIKEGIRSQSQRDAYYYELVNLKREGIVDVPQDEIINALAMSGISDLKEAIERQQQQAQQQQQKVDAQERLGMELINSQKEANLALAQVRRARELGEVGLMEERMSEASQNRAQAALDRAKTITEIANMRDDRILKVLDFVNMLERQEAEDRQSVAEQASVIKENIDTSTEGTTENKQTIQQ